MRTLIVGIALIVRIVPAYAQGVSSPTSGDPAQCAEWSTRATRGSDDQERRSAIQSLRLCPVAGPATAEQLWSNIATHSKTQLKLLRALSLELRDGRLVNPMLSALRNPALPDTTRATALAILASFADPRIILSPEFLLSPNPKVTPSFDLARRRTPGTRPVTVQDKRQIRDAIGDLATGSASDPLQKGAIYLAGWFDSAPPAEK